MEEKFEPASQDEKRKIRDLIKQGKFAAAEQDKVTTYREDVILLLQVLGYDPRYCLVTDLSMVADFCDDEEDLVDVSETIGIDTISPNEYFWEVAIRMKNQEEGQ
jgi:hypothetical protein